MASSRVTPFPLHGQVPFRGQLYRITGAEVFRGDRLYHLGREANGRYDERVLVPHGTLLDGMEARARHSVGEMVRHPELGPARVVERRWRFAEGRIMYRLACVQEPWVVYRCYQEELEEALTGFK